MSLGEDFVVADILRDLLQGSRVVVSASVGEVDNNPKVGYSVQQMSD